MKGQLKDGTWVDIKKNGSLTGRSFEKIMIDDTDDFEWVDHLRCRLSGGVRSSHVSLPFKLFPDLSAFAEAAKKNRGEIKPYNEFKDFSISDRLQMIETLNQVVSSDKGLALDHTKEAAKKLQQLIESL